MGSSCGKPDCLSGGRRGHRDQHRQMEPTLIIDKLRKLRKNIQKDDDDDLNEADFKAMMIDNIRQKYDTVEAIKRLKTKAFDQDRTGRALSQKNTKRMQVNFEWEEIKELGRGSFGSVWLAKKVKTGESMAVKMINISGKQVSLEDAMREIYLLSEMSHNKNVVNLIGFKKDDEKMHIFMEYVEGGSIESQIKKYNSPIKEKLAAKYTFQILKGLRFLHEKGVIHGDLKCGNILIDRKGNCKLADFGSAQKVINEDNIPKIFGTVCYMAPEIIMQKGFSYMTDIWSLGATVFEMLTTFPPFYDKSATQWTIMHKIAGTEELPYLGDKFSDQVKDFVYACMKRDPSKRPTAEKLLEHPFVMSYRKLLDQNDEEIEVIDKVEQSPEDSIVAERVIKQGKEAISFDIRLEKLQDRSASNGSRQSIRLRNEGSTPHLIPFNEKNITSFNLGARPSTPVGLTGFAAASYQELMELENSIIDKERYCDIDSKIRLSDHDHSIMRTTSNAFSRVTSVKKPITTQAVTLKELLIQKTPSIPDFRPLGKIMSFDTALSAKTSIAKQTSRSKQSQSFKQKMGKAVRQDSIREPGKDLQDISTFPMGYNPDNTLAQAEVLFNDEDRQDRETLEALATDLKLVPSVGSEYRGSILGKMLTAQSNYNTGDP